MSAVAEKPQHLRALDQANAIRLQGARERRALQGGAPIGTAAAALVDPGPGLANYRLRTLFANPSVIRRFGLRGLRKAMGDVERDYPWGRDWHVGLRLCDLTRDERRRLAEAIVKREPKYGSEAA